MHAPLSSPKTARRIPRTPTRSRLAGALVVAALLAATTACGDDSTSPASRLVYGASQALGNGTARSYVALDASGRPTSLGVAISETAMGSLPQTPMPGMPAAAMLTLALPTEAATTGFNHVMLDWNPAGHEPDQVYTHPHFDFHFYQITPAERDQIVPGNPQFGTKAGNFPGAEYVPAGFVAGSVLANVPPANAAVPLMGMHWLDTSSPELQPPPNNHAFTRTFIYGSYDGRFIFVEPMITKAFIETAKTKAGGYSFPVNVPAKVSKTGAYPSSYSIAYHAAAKEYRIALDALVMKQAAQ
ncbi:MAG TPA: DUF5602 domain-containing protein [Gemmatimonadaceae bacterium]|nr:DUF5602 domain-containing protein [Gemmatimonadaceae bacterium]